MRVLEAASRGAEPRAFRAAYVGTLRASTSTEAEAPTRHRKTAEHSVNSGSGLFSARIAVGTHDKMLGVVTRVRSSCRRPVE